MNSFRPSNNLAQAASELESMRCLNDDTVEFPTSARALLYSIPGNDRCIDCGSLHPQWASVTFGALLCLQCSGTHRSYGVQTSFVRSVDMDTWSHTQVLRMLEGGNAQLQQFFDRHRMSSDDSRNMKQKRYHTKAAKFYRIHLAQHAQDVKDAGVYLGREATRQRVQQQQQQDGASCNSSDEDNSQQQSQEQPCSASTMQPHQQTQQQQQQQQIAVQ